MKKKTKKKNRTKDIQLAKSHAGGLAAKVALVEKETLRKDELPPVTPGDTVKMHVRIKEGEKERVQIFEGVVLGFANRGGGRSVMIRKISHGVGVERVFLLNSPKVAKIELVQPGKIRRAKLYYLRELEGKKARIERDIGAAAAIAASEAAKKAAASAQK